MFGAVKILRSMGVAAALFAGALIANSASAAEAFMQTGGLTSQPIGHYEFCKRLPDECSIRSRNVAPAKMTRDFWELIVNVNSHVNQTVKPLTDMEIYGVEEYWGYPDKVGNVGDCEDYVLEKRRELMQAGISPADLLITVVRKPDGEGHAVLTVRTDTGDFILDNLADNVKNWSETEYTYLKRQATNNTGRWVSIEAPSNILVGSVH
ncbi:transglutaminase-like cysteine peptidase [Phyllobacterium myrsinacearum]|uniref:Transglutaminase n=3 Tax=Bacteria TaxID=2 RepID=A0A2S9JJ23_9HYPH|nr:transglutaminase-like cysteine peptidase [Phyllobacterium myrsinacearum]PRD53072.1 transglutaminase [Phyllobacterium myrsinacearum]PWV94085.1 putative transglutaminase-like cysteine proteinase [Phyllobacterium myrsinacearum]RZV07476.1 putative transglutaminase-like cysteine proteinase [Phyllobacterium myrsinacearum]